MDMKEIDRRIKRGVRNIQISPLFEKGKVYNIDRNSPKYEKEDTDGTMSPDVTHCWLSWEAMWRDENGIDHFGNEVWFCKDLEEAEEVKKYLEKHLVKAV